jgi:HAE1 family hydrophobic/amphiphilic exporter-1
MSEIQEESTAEIAQAFLLATILTFMLLAAIMNSFIHPFTIATSIVTSFAGVFVALFLSGASFNVGAMLAFIMLVGLVVNNNILVLEPTVQRVQRGEDAQKVLWEELMNKKRMIWMTTIAVVAGMIPQLWSNDGLKVAMGAVMIGGMSASLIWTFTLTPSLFFVMEKLRKKIYRLK